MVYDVETVFYPYSTNYGFAMPFATPFTAWSFVQQVLNYLGTNCARFSSVFYFKFCRSRQILCLALRQRPSAILLNNLVSDFYIPLSTPLSCTSLIHQTECFFFSISLNVQDLSEVLKKVEVIV